MDPRHLRLIGLARLANKRYLQLGPADQRWASMFHRCFWLLKSQCRGGALDFRVGRLPLHVRDRRLMCQRRGLRRGGDFSSEGKDTERALRSLSLIDMARTHIVSKEARPVSNPRPPTVEVATVVKVLKMSNDLHIPAI